MRRYLVIGAAAAMLAVPALASGRATTTVTVEAGGVNQFKPSDVTKNVGAGGIHWQWGTSGMTLGFHNVRQDDKLFYSGPLTRTNSAGFDVIPSAGGFHYYCELHNFNMTGTIKVRPQIFNKTANSFGVRWSTGSNDTGGKFDALYRVDGGQWKTWKNDVTAAGANFGANNFPVRVRQGHTYDVKARSEKSTDTTKVSDWSPLARVTT